MHIECARSLPPSPPQPYETLGWKPALTSPAYSECDFCMSIFRRDSFQVSMTQTYSCNGDKYFGNAHQQQQQQQQQRQQQTLYSLNARVKIYEYYTACTKIGCDCRHVAFIRYVHADVLCTLRLATQNLRSIEQDKCAKFQSDCRRLHHSHTCYVCPPMILHTYVCICTQASPTYIYVYGTCTTNSYIVMYKSVLVHYDCMCMCVLVRAHVVNMCFRHWTVPCVFFNLILSHSQCVCVSLSFSHSLSYGHRIKRQIYT